MWFRDHVNNTANKGASALLTADIDLSGSEWTAGISGFSGVFNGQGHIISGFSLTQTNAATGAGYALFAKTTTAARILNVGLDAASVTAYKKARRGYIDIQTAALVGINNGGIFNCFVSNSTVTVRSKSTPKSGVLCGSNAGSIENCFVINSEVLDKSNKTHLGGIAGENTGTVKSVYSVNVRISTTSTANIHPIATGSIENAYYEQIQDDSRTFTGGEKKEKEWFLSDDAIDALGNKYFSKDTNTVNNGYPVLTFYGGSSSAEVDKRKLKEVLDALPTEGYYTANDRYNGKCSSANGFWTDFQQLIASAKSVYDQPNATQEAVDAAVKELNDKANVIQVAVGNLIPSTRANTTPLYEELLNTPSKDDYTPKSWAAYSSLRSESETMMASMFDKAGNPTEANSSDQQPALEKLAGDLKTARGNLDERKGEYGKSKAEFYHAAIEYLAGKFDPDKLSGYTAESISALRTAREAALAAAEDYPAYSTIGNKELQALSSAEEAFRQTCYQLVNSGEEQISVRFSAVDATGAYTGRRQNTANTSVLTLAANTTVGAVLDQFGISTSLTYNDNYLLVFVNGDLYFGIADGYLGVQYQNIVLHNGDELTVVHFRPKMVAYSSGAGQYPAQMDDVRDWFRYSVISAPETVTAGQPFTITVTADGALPQNRTGAASPVSGAAVYTSAAFADKADAAAADVRTPAYASTGADGTAQITLYAEGWTAVNAFRLDDEGRYTNGPTVLVYVEAADDLNAIKTQLRKELDAVYYDDNYPESSFTPENWKKLTAAYNAGVSGIEAAETSGAAREAQMTALQTIKQMQQEADSSNRGNLETFRQYLNRLPDDATKLDEASKDAVERLISAYEKMTEYQKGELTAKEQEKYDAIAAAYAKGLDKPASYSLSFEQKYVGIPEADQQALERMIAYLQANTPTDDKYGDVTGNQQLQPLFSFTKDGQITEAVPLTYNIKASVSPDYIAYLLCRDAARKDGKHNGPGVLSGDGWSISDAEVGVDFDPMGNVATMTGSMIYTVNGTRYAIRSISVEGTTVPLTNANSNTWQYKTGGLIDATDYKGKTENHINYQVPNALIDFHMPYNDVKITVTWGPVSGTEDEVNAARESALAVLAAAYAQYDSGSEHYAAITAAYQTGVDAVNTAKTVAAVTEARTTAIQAMKTAAGSGTIGTPIEGWGYDDRFDAGAQVGTVTVSFENTTYNDGFFYYTNWVTDDNPTGAFVWKENYPLGENDNMMTVALRALVDEFPDATWSGTGIGFELSYLAGIKANSYSLAAFDGGSESGWMGTLNDWFTNEGFQVFSVADGKLGDGDYIRIMYTTTGYGEDLGGTWYDSYTTLDSLEVEGGTLLSEFTPGESGGTYDYTLLISGNSANVKLTPTATNKNFLTKIFLNEKVTSNTEGGSFYKRTQYIPVTTGDTIYVGCGARAWPTMNNQAGNAQDNDGTWYVLHVVNADDGSAYVVSLIDNLPDTVRYENYTATKSSIDAAEAAYGALSETAKANVTNYAKLERLKAEVESFEQIDAFKKQLAAIPNVKRITLENREAIEQAKAAYDDLTADQKEYLTRSEEEKMQALVARLAELIEEADRAAAAAVDRLIDQIGTVTLESEEDITAARTAYSALTEKQKGYVTKLDVLTAAETQLQNLKDAAAAKRVEDMIAALPGVSELALSNEADITAARAAFDALTSVQKALVPNEATLIAAEQRLAELKAEAEQEAADRAAAKSVEDKINALPADLTLDDKPTVDAAKAAYDALTEKQKGYVSPDAKQTLDDALAEIERLEEERDNKAAAAVVERLIDAIGEVSLSSKPTIDTARSAYDQLTPVQKTFVSNYDVLVAAETRYAQLVDEAAAEYVRELIENLGDVTLDSKEAIEAARAAYDALTPSQKALISEATYRKLTDAEDAYAALVDKAAAERVEDLIDAIGRVTPSSGSKIAAARAAYDALTPSQKKLVGNYQTLLDAEKRYEDLMKPVKPVGPSKPSTPTKPDTSKDNLPFTDVASGSWYYDGVKYAYDNGLMNGTGAKAFSPNADTTRGMIVTILARMEGVNTSGGAAWYARGREWATENGISDGTNMEGKITREQLAAMLYRYAKMKGYDVSASASLSGYTDASSVSGWAKEAMQWAVGSGLIQGSNNALTPQANASRAQIATILMRFAQNIAK